MVHGHARHALANALDTLARTAGSTFAVNDAPDARRDRVVLRLSPAGADVVLPAGYRGRLDWTADALTAVTTQQLAANLLLVVALALGSAGHPATARRVISTLAPQATLLGGPEAAAWIGTLYCADLAGADLVELAERIVAPAAREAQGAAVTLDAANALLVPLWFAYPHRAITARAPVSAALAGFARALLAEPWPAELAAARATLIFNVGHFVGLTRTDARSALTYYAAAARLDPEYRARAHFWAEVAGLLFDASRYRWSARAYERAATLNSSDADLLGRRADALVHAHDFETARAVYAAYLARREADWDAVDASTPAAPDVPRVLPDVARYSAWYLKAVTLPDVAAAAQAARAASDVPDVAAGDAAGELPPSARDAEAPQQIAASDAALARDPLDTRAWFNRGVATARLGQQAAARVAFTVAACYDPGDVDAWAAAAILATGPASVELLPPIVWAAHGVHGDVFLRSLDHRIDQQGPGHRERLRGGVTRIVAAAPPQAEPHELRMLLPNGAVAVFAVGPERDE